MIIRCRLTALELLDYLEGMCVNQALWVSYFEMLRELCDCQSTVLLQRAPATQCPQADFFWEIYLQMGNWWSQGFVARGRYVGLGSVQCLL